MCTNSTEENNDRYKSIKNGILRVCDEVHEKTVRRCKEDT